MILRIQLRLLKEVKKLFHNKQAKLFIYEHKFSEIYSKLIEVKCCSTVSLSPEEEWETCGFSDLWATSEKIILNG